MSNNNPLRFVFRRQSAALSVEAEAGFYARLRTVSTSFLHLFSFLFSSLSEPGEGPFGRKDRVVFPARNEVRKTASLWFHFPIFRGVALLFGGPRRVGKGLIRPFAKTSQQTILKKIRMPSQGSNAPSPGPARHLT
jgi:hypothetical protein